MARLDRSPLLTSLLLALALAGPGCDHDRGDPLGPLDIENRDHREQREPELAERPYVAPVDLELDWALDQRVLRADSQNEIVARVRIEAPEHLDLPRPPARVVLVVDTSASMRGEAIEGAKAAAAALVDSLSDGDSFSLVVFHSRAEVMMNATLIGEHSRAAAKAEIERMQAWGTTDLAGGLELALGQLGAAPQNLEPADSELHQLNAGIWHSGGPDPAVLERVVLLGDGVPNDARSIPNLTQAFVSRGAEITTLGYGLDFDEVLLATLAEQTHGSFTFVEEPERVASLFRDEVLHIQRTVARDLHLGLGLGPGVALLEVVGHPTRWNDAMARNELALGSIAEGQSVELVLRLAVGPHHEGATVELSDLELAFTDVYTGTGNRFERSFLSALSSADEQEIAASRDLEIARLGARARTDAATLRVLELARSGDLKASKLLLSQSVSWAEEAATELEDEQLREKAAALAALEPELAGLVRAARQVPVSAAGLGSAPQPFPAQPSPAASRAVKSAHADAYNALH